jgi:phosphoribosylanthranilate isomerase
MWVKICANTSVEDTLKAVELGADAVGFVFAPSKRRVDAAQVKAIAERLPDGVERVGVFTTDDAEAIAAIVRKADLTAVQLHGGVNPELVRRLRATVGEVVPIIHTVPWSLGDDEGSEHTVREQLRQLVPGDRVLIDAKVGKTSGGLGVSFDWVRAAHVFEEFPALRMIVAGGLRPETVAEAIEILKPYGVDVASGVERESGHKDFQKLADFIENARRA